MNMQFGAPQPGGSAFDARPSVAIRRNDRTGWWFAGAAVLAAALLFSTLEARRRGAEQDRGGTSDMSLATPEAIPDLVVPAMPVDPSLAVANPGQWAQPGDQQSRPAAAGAAQLRPVMSQPSPSSQSYPEISYQPAVPPPPMMVSGQSGPMTEAPAADARGKQSEPSERILAGKLENPATTVVQGTLINAVLETALDSTRPGQTRALVTRDVFGFDGTRLLIPRGTRLYGVYEADIAQGQKRAQIRWTRLLRPDGVSVALDSPAADPLGRAGVEGRVDNHFMQRFGNALLGTTMSIGSTLATRSISSPVVIAVPGTGQAASQAVMPGSTQIAPTLTVRQGTRITVFVQHDLDFTSADVGS
jgi:type IV secretion system protein VirB10